MQYNISTVATLKAVLPLAVVLLATAPLGVAQITYTEIDYPGSVGTGITGINNLGVMVGEYQLTVGGPNYGFTLNQGTFTTFQYPGGVFTYPNGINDSGQIVGDTCTTICGFPYVFGFLYDGQTFSEIKYAGSIGTEANAINNAGQIALRADDGLYSTRAFELSDGVFTELRPSGNAHSEGALGINNLGEIVGFSFIPTDRSWELENGLSRLLDIGASSVAFGVNDNGIIVGWYYYDGGQTYPGFVWSKGKYISLSYPGACETIPTGINNSGQVVGYYETPCGYENHGFVTSPITEADFAAAEAAQPPADAAKK